MASVGSIKNFTSMKISILTYTRPRKINKNLIISLIGTNAYLRNLPKSSAGASQPGHLHKECTNKGCELSISVGGESLEKNKNLSLLFFLLFECF